MFMDYGEHVNIHVSNFSDQTLIIECIKNSQ